MDGAANGDHGEAAVLDLSELVVGFSFGGLCKSKGVDAEVARVCAVLIVHLLVCGSLAHSHEKENLGNRKEANAAHCFQRVHGAVLGVWQVVHHLREDPANEGEHTDTAYKTNKQSPSSQ